MTAAGDGKSATTASANSSAEKQVSGPTTESSSVTAPSASPAINDPLKLKLAAARRAGRKGASYRIPSAAELQRTRRWLAQLLAAPSAQAGPDGFSSERVAAGQLLIHHPRRVGAGALVLSTPATAPWLVEVPHSYFDRRTLEVGLAVFQQMRARALLVNTVHRGVRQSRDGGERRSSSASDMAQAPQSYFQTAHEALLAASPRVVTVQFHGFADASAPGVDVIVSAADTSANIAELAASLERLELGAVKRYPEQVAVLGGTTNVQARSCRARKLPFIHVELSATLRDRLHGDDALLRRFAQAFAVIVPKRQ